MINRGGFRIEKKFLSDNELTSSIDFALSCYDVKTRTHEEGSKYGNIDWFQVPIEKKDIAFTKFLSKFNLFVDDITLSVVYYLEPGAKIHAHRDLTGASINNRIRFHIPLITNKNVEFYVGKDKIHMKPGELWILDTSYKHSVFNGGDHSRAHIVFECRINEEIKKYLFNDYKAKLHTFNFAIWGMLKFSESLLVNIYKDPKYFVKQMRMVFRFIVLKISGKY